jgi:hypothetical protein
VNHTREPLLVAVPRQSFRPRSRYEAAPGPSGAEIADQDDPEVAAARADPRRRETAASRTVAAGPPR